MTALLVDSPSNPFIINSETFSVVSKSSWVNSTNKNEVPLYRITVAVDGAYYSIEFEVHHKNYDAVPLELMTIMLDFLNCESLSCRLSHYTKSTNYLLI